MAYYVQTLVSRSFNLAGIVSKDFQGVTGDQIHEGIDLLNELLAETEVNTGLIPFYKVHDEVAVAGHEIYFIENLIECSTFTYFLSGVRMVSAPTRRDKYWGTTKPTNVTSIPARWNVERTLGGSNLNLWFTPDTNYPLQIMGKFNLSSVALNQDLSLTLPLAYIQYLRYALAEYIDEEYGLTFPPQSAKKLRELKSRIKNISRKDMTIRKQSSLSGKSGLNIAQYVVGQGYTAG